MTPVTMVMEGTVESASWYLLRAGSYCVSYINSFDPYWQDCSSPILQIRKLRYQEEKALSQGHTDPGSPKALAPRAGDTQPARWPCLLALRQEQNRP